VIQVLTAWARRLGRANPHAYSLRRRLISAILGASVLMWTISTGVVMYVAWEQTSDVFDDALKDTARLTLALGSPSRSQGSMAARTQDEKELPELHVYFQIIDRAGHVVQRADDAPSQPFSPELDKHSGFRDVWIDGQAWHVYLLRGKDSDFQVQVGQPWKKRIALLRDMAQTLLWPALVLLVLLTGFCAWIIHRLLLPIEQTARRISTKSPDDLTPVPTTSEPLELQPIVRSFNVVLSRLGQAIEQERSFTADAAHQLRTPLAGLRMRIQLMQRQQAAEGMAETASGHGEGLQSLRDSVDRCTTLTESLLTLARLDPTRPETLEKNVVDLPKLLEQIRRDLMPTQTAALHIDCGVATLHAHASLLQSALRNIVDNALRYGPPDGPVHIKAVAQQGRCRITVRDQGPCVRNWVV
jgi:two-component system sensor histidine kinase QseC